MNYIRNQIRLVKERDPSIVSSSEALLHPSIKAVIYYRLSHYLYINNHKFLSRFLCMRCKKRTGIEIHPGAIIGENLFIDHGSGVVIGQTCIIGNNVTIYQDVTLGGTGKETGKRHPTICDNVFIGSGAKVLGNIIVGRNSKIGANAVVLKDVPEDSTAVGVPARIVNK
ncbi:MAG: serine O-acetyltransferase [Bacilli bacterium]